MDLGCLHRETLVILLFAMCFFFDLEKWDFLNRKKKDLFSWTNLRSRKNRTLERLAGKPKK